MSRTRVSLIRGVLALGMLDGTFAIAQGFQAPSAPGGAPNLAARFCVSCHGAGLAGGRAESLVDDAWTFGGDDKSVARSIREGRANGAMPGFASTLSESQALALVTYMREEAARARRGPRRPPRGPAPGQVVKSERHSFRIELVARGLSTPWGIDFLPDGRLVVTERPGRLRFVTPGQPLPGPIAGLPRVWARQDGGLMDVALHPEYAKNGWIYLSFSDPGTNGASMTTIVRGRVRDGRWVDQETLFKAPLALYWADDTHFGSRFLFDGQNRLFYSIGDRGRQDEAQDLSRPNGKIHRILDDGRVPAQNPFVGRARALGSIWSYGNRNAQGLAFHPVTGELWATEHGPRGGDELNLIEPGRNYGWPLITHGINYDGTPITDKTEAAGMEQPITQWTPSLATGAIAFYTGEKFPGWRNDLFLATLVGRELRRLVLEGRKVVHQEVLLANAGRVREVATGPDGYLYLALNQPDLIVRLVPAEAPPR
jgi:glucose/arabinose dehydrogenase